MVLCLFKICLFAKALKEKLFPNTITVNFQVKFDGLRTKRTKLTVKSHCSQWDSIVSEAKNICPKLSVFLAIIARSSESLCNRPKSHSNPTQKYTYTKLNFLAKQLSIVLIVSNHQPSAAFSRTGFLGI